MKRPVIFAPAGPRTEPLASGIAAAIGGDIHRPERGLGSSMCAHFATGHPIVGVYAAGILMRILGKVLRDKWKEPPVICVTPDGRYVIPLVGAHHGGNALGRVIALAIGAELVLSTAIDLAFGLPLDELPAGYVLHNRWDYEDFAVELLSGKSVRIVGEAPWLSSLPQSDDSELEILITPDVVEGSTKQLVIHPQIYAVGLGFERGTSGSEVGRLLSDILRAHKVNSEAVACYATIDLKEDEEAIKSWGNVRLFTADELDAQSHRIANPSQRVKREVGTPSVAEAAALAAAGPDSELVVPKTKSTRATVAVARAKFPIVDGFGRRRGILKVIGLGPGSRENLSFLASEVLGEVSEIVGYAGYFDVNDVRPDSWQTVHRFALGQELDRARHAISLAKTGKDVALICSGDPGIYAMAALVYELLDLEPCRIAVEVIPGISAFQSAAAKAGAMIGHDFCCISLSDLLTPRAVIERRVRAAAEGDFVIAFYNPQSQKRRDLLDGSIATLREHRPADTPVVIARNLERPDESVRIVRLADFRSDEVDMLTLVMVGSSQSRAFTRGDGRTYAYTPRGYARKREPSA